MFNCSSNISFEDVTYGLTAAEEMYCCAAGFIISKGVFGDMFHHVTVDALFKHGATRTEVTALRNSETMRTTV